MLRRGRRGQSAVLVALCLFTMLLLVAMSTNIGIVVNDRIRMQSTADLSTYAVAYSEAASMNELVELNKGIAEEVQSCRRTLRDGPIGGDWPETTPCGCIAESQIAELVVTECKMAVDTRIDAFVRRARYSQTVSPALAAGERTADENFTGVDVTFFQDLLGSPTARGTYNMQYGYNFGGFMIEPSVAELRQVADTALNYTVFVTCGEYCEPLPHQLSIQTTWLRSWFYKESRDPDVWVAGRVSGTPEKQFLDTAFGTGSRDGGYFGASSTGGSDEMFAYAVAKPYDGSIGPSELSGNQRNGNTPGPFGVYAPRGVEYPEMSMYDEYRARLAGINEDLAGYTTPGELITIDGWENGYSWDSSRFKH
jgi:hypothetical protein